jgi:hypothetical protein
MALGVAVFAFCARSANMYVQEPVCQICRWGVPYAGLAAEIKERGFESGRLVVNDRETGGNLHRFFPDAPVTLVGGRFYGPASGAAVGRTALVWPADQSDDAVAAQFQRALPRLRASDLAAAATISIPWGGHLWKPDGYRVSAWKLLILGDAASR